MDQQSELAKVKARIRALAAKTVDRGCSEAEAMAAAAKVGELLAVYGLTMSEVELREEVCLQRRLPVLGPVRQAMRWLFPSLLRLCECRGWTDGRQDFVLFGLEPDVQMAEYLMAVIARALETEETRYRASTEYAQRRQPAQAVLRSFRYGFADRVGKRLDAMARDREKAETRHHAANTGTALVLVKQQIIQEKFRGLGVNLRTVYSTATVRDRDAYSRGAEAGGRVGLRRPVEGGAGGGALPRRGR
jgi:Protein of unknown function (DUF2786)